MDKYKQELIDTLLLAAKDKKTFTEFLTDILTPAEYGVLAKRWQIVKRLERGENQRFIAGELNIGIAIVTRGSRELRNPNGGFRLMLKKLKGKK